MPWVMAAMTAAQMLQGEQNRQKAAKVNEAEIRYAPWTGGRQIASVPNSSMDTAQQGVTGIYGQMQNQKKSDLQDKLTEAQIKRLEMFNGKTRPGGSMMNEYNADYGSSVSPMHLYSGEQYLDDQEAARLQGPGSTIQRELGASGSVRGYDMNAGVRNVPYTQQNPYSRLRF